MTVCTVRLRRAARLNATVGTVSVALYAGFSDAKLLKAHFQHHRAPGTDDDPDFSVVHSREPMRWFVTFVLTILVGVSLQRSRRWLYMLALGVPLERMLCLGAAGDRLIHATVRLRDYLPHHTEEAPFVDQIPAARLMATWGRSLAATTSDITTNTICIRRYRGGSCRLNAKSVWRTLVKIIER